MKKLHLFTLKSFIGPLIGTFFIALFILLLQILWRYIDILVGKGLELPIIAELLYYSILQVIPMALPLAILLASLMTFGNMGENYELTAIKASGVSLFKMMKPLIILTTTLSIAAFVFSDNVMPWANLKFYALMNSIKTQQPELEIKEKEFVNLGNYSIKAEHKNKETGTLKDLMIYDHSNEKTPHTNTTVADTGYLKMDDNINMMRITLLNGVRYEENARNKQDSLTTNDKRYYRIDKFKKQVALIDIENNKLSVDETGYANHNKMKSVKQLSMAISEYRDKQKEIVSEANHQSFLPKIQSINDSLITNPQSLITSVSKSRQIIALKSAKRKAQHLLYNLKSGNGQIQSYRKKIINHQVELHRKFTLPFTCFIFFFIGASLGAIIRKGGFGMPVIMAIILFIAFYMLDTFGSNMAKKEVIPVYIGMWLSSFVLLIIAVTLSYQSTTDSSLLNFEDLKTAIKRKMGIRKRQIKS